MKAEEATAAELSAAAKDKKKICRTQIDNMICNDEENYFQYW